MKDPMSDGRRGMLGVRHVTRLGRHMWSDVRRALCDIRHRKACSSVLQKTQNLQICFWIFWVWENVENFEKMWHSEWHLRNIALRSVVLCRLFVFVVDEAVVRFVFCISSLTVLVDSVSHERNINVCTHVCVCVVYWHVIICMARCTSLCVIMPLWSWYLIVVGWIYHCRWRFWIICMARCASLCVIMPLWLWYLIVVGEFFTVDEGVGSHARHHARHHAIMLVIMLFCRVKMPIVKNSNFLLSWKWKMENVICLL